MKNMKDTFMSFIFFMFFMSDLSAQWDERDLHRSRARTGYDSARPCLSHPDPESAPMK
jgi:hypothetical protein